MPVIPFLGYDANGFIADSALVTQKEFEEFLKDNQNMPKAYIVTAFIKEYFDKNKLSIDLDKIVLNKSMVSVETLYPAHLSIEEAKNIVTDLGLDCNDFINKYAEYLKKL